MAGALLDVLGLAGLAKAAKAPAAAMPQAGAPPSAGAQTQAGAPPLAGAPPVDKNLTAFQTARAAIAQLLDALKADTQAGHLGAQIAQAQGKLDAADAAAGSAKWKDATARLGECRAIVAAAQKLAKEWAGYAAKRAVANSLVYALKNSDAPTEFTDRQALLSGADALANQTPPKFALALKELAKIDADTRPDVQGLVAGARGRLKECMAANAKAREFIKDDIVQATPLVVAAEAALKAGEFAKAMQNASAAYDIVGPAHRMIGRRDGYEKQRVTTVATIAKVRALPAVQSRAAALDTMVADADKLAARDSMRVEEGIKLLKDAFDRADRLVKLAPVISSSASERTAAEKDIQAALGVDTFLRAYRPD